MGVRADRSFFPSTKIQLPVNTLEEVQRAKWADKVLERLHRNEQQSVGTKLDAAKVPAALVALTMLALLVKPPQTAQERARWRRRWGGRLLYAVTTLNPLISVLANDYTFIRAAAKSYVAARKKHGGFKRLKDDFFHGQEERLRQLVIGVGAIKPRRLFAAGATLRGVQLHTPLYQLFDPPAHFGAGINLLALFDVATGEIKTLPCAAY